MNFTCVCWVFQAQALLGVMDHESPPPCRCWQCNNFRFIDAVYKITDKMNKGVIYLKGEATVRSQPQTYLVRQSFVITAKRLFKIWTKDTKNKQSSHCSVYKDQLLCSTSQSEHFTQQVSFIQVCFPLSKCFLSSSQTITLMDALGPTFGIQTWAACAQTTNRPPLCLAFAWIIMKYPR